MNFNNIDSKIEINLKRIDFYHNLYQRNQNKFSFLIIIYSFICFYILEIIKYPFREKYEAQDCFYVLFLLVFIFYLYKSISKTYFLVKPVEIAYLNQPKYFYNEVKEMYKKELKIKGKKLLNEYIKHSYLKETESVLENNVEVYNTKSQIFYDNFKNILICLILYVFLASYVIIQNKKQSTSFELQNFKEIINYKDSIIMAKTEKPKVDPKMVITTKPVMVKESVNMNMQKKENVNKKINNNTKK